MTTSYLYLLTKAVITLVFVLGLLALAMFVLKRYLSRHGGRGLKKLGSPIKVLSTTFLGQKKNLAIVEVAGELLLIGVTQESITCLARLDSPETIQKLKQLETERPRALFGLFN